MSMSAVAMATGQTFDPSLLAIEGTDLLLPVGKHRVVVGPGFVGPGFVGPGEVEEQDGPEFVGPGESEDDEAADGDEE